MRNFRTPMGTKQLPVPKDEILTKEEIVLLKFKNGKEQVEYLNSLTPFEKKIYVLKHNIDVEKRHIEAVEKSRSNLLLARSVNHYTYFLDCHDREIQSSTDKLKKLEEDLEKV